MPPKGTDTGLTPILAAEPSLIIPRPDPGAPPPPKPLQSIQLVNPLAPPVPVAAEPPKVQKVERRRTRTHEVQPPIVWTIEQLRSGSDPLGKGLALLIDKGASSALFLAISAPLPGAKVPLFVSTAATLADASRLTVWTGLRWDPALTPDIWNVLLKQGYADLPANNPKVAHASLRASFGAGNGETLTLVRIGPVSACRGLLAVISAQSLMFEIPKVFSLFNAPLPKAA